VITSGVAREAASLPTRLECSSRALVFLGCFVLKDLFGGGFPFCEGFAIGSDLGGSVSPGASGSKLKTALQPPIGTRAQGTDTV
jgi:hypothetical protein